MGQISMSITKRVSFRDSVQHFTNTYTYRSATVNPQPSLANDMIDEVVVSEKKWHSTDVTFVRASVWSSGGTKEENQMIFEKQLSGTGSSTPSTSMDRERAFLIMWRAGMDTLGRPVYLRKWYHSCGAFGSTAVTTANLQNVTGLTTTQRDTIAALADEITRISMDVWGLTAESGRERTGWNELPIAHKYLEHHQLGDEWRAN